MTLWRNTYQYGWSLQNTNQRRGYGLESRGSSAASLHPPFPPKIILSHLFGQIETMRSHMEIWEQQNMPHGRKMNPQCREIIIQDVVTPRGVAAGSNFWLTRNWELTPLIRGICICMFVCVHAYTFLVITLTDWEGPKSARHTWNWCTVLI